VSSPAAHPDPQLYARSFTDVYQHWYHDLDDPQIMVQAFQRRCDEGAQILELGSGTGRLATPLHCAGFQILALDASTAMLATAPAGPHPCAADMAVIPMATGCADAVLIAYNTILNLDSHGQQQACFREIERVLRPGGVAAIEAFIADTTNPSSFGVTIRSHPSKPNERIAIVTGPDASDPDVIVGSHVELGSKVVCRPWRLRYASPFDLDRCALDAGLVVSERTSDWADTAFDPAGHRHVTWYRRP